VLAPGLDAVPIRCALFDTPLHHDGASSVMNRTKEHPHHGDVCTLCPELPLAPATAISCYQIFARMMRQAEEDRLITKSPCRRQELRATLRG
jgi:hypothetical protein